MKNFLSNYFRDFKNVPLKVYFNFTNIYYFIMAGFFAYIYGEESLFWGILGRIMLITYPFTVYAWTYFRYEKLKNPKNYYEYMFYKWHYLEEAFEKGTFSKAYWESKNKLSMEKYHYLNFSTGRIYYHDGNATVDPFHNFFVGLGAVTKRIFLVSFLRLIVTIIHFGFMFFSPLYFQKH